MHQAEARAARPEPLEPGVHRVAEALSCARSSGSGTLECHGPQCGCSPSVVSRFHVGPREPRRRSPGARMGVESRRDRAQPREPRARARPRAAPRRARARTRRRSSEARRAPGAPSTMCRRPASRGRPGRSGRGRREAPASRPAPTAPRPPAARPGGRRGARSAPAPARRSGTSSSRSASYWWNAAAAENPNRAATSRATPGTSVTPVPEPQHLQHGALLEVSAASSSISGGSSPARGRSSGPSDAVARRARRRRRPRSCRPPGTRPTPARRRGRSRARPPRRRCARTRRTS